MSVRLIEGVEAKNLGRREKWDLLSPFLKQHGREALAYATLQDGMEYFLDDDLGYISYLSICHPVFARKTKRIALSDPICDRNDYGRLVNRFLEYNSHAAFAVISEGCAAALRELKFKANCIGFEPELAIQTYNTKGNWKELDLIKRARNEAKREGITIKEVDIEAVGKERLDAVTRSWIQTKKVNDREIWVYARRPVFEIEEDVRKFVAYDKDGNVAGFAFYDPIYRDGKVAGYAANILRCDEKKYGRLGTAVHMEAMERFKTEGKEVLNLMLAPFVHLDQGVYNDDWATKAFFQISERFGNDIYNFKGLSFHKSKYRGTEKSLYYASNSLWPSNDIYLAFLSADITRSYFTTMSRLAWGALTSWKTRKIQPHQDGE